MDGWKQAVPRLRKELESQAKFKELYKYSYGMNLEEGKKVINIETACALWDLFIPAAKCQFLEQWKAFLMKKEQDGSLLAISRDVWALFYDLVDQTKGNLANFEDDGAWPALVDQFIESLQ